MRHFYSFFITIALLILATQNLSAKKIEVEDQYDFKMALDYAFTANVDTILLTTSGGVYTTTDTMHLAILEPLVIMAAPGLAERPILTNSDPNQQVLDILRIYADFTVEGVIFDGGNDVCHGMKYALRCDNDETRGYTVDPDADIIVKDCIFRNFFQDKDITKDGHVFKVAKVKVGTVKFENCLIDGTGYEAIRLTDTEKWATEKTCDTLIVNNCTFTNCDAEAIRFYADKDTSNHNDAYVLLEHLTFFNTATRVIFVKNNNNTLVRDIIVANSRLSGHGRDDYIIQIQTKGSVISNVDTFMVTTLDGTYAGRELYVSKNGGKGAEESTFWGFDPLFRDSGAMDLTLLSGSHAYYAGHDGSALGDLNWATETPNVIPFTYEIQGSGALTFDPPLNGQSYEANTTVTITAIADSAWEFQGWQGDASGTDNPLSITVDAAKHITAVFAKVTAIDDNLSIVRKFKLEQNYPNPFNPQTVISYQIPKDEHVRLTVYDSRGSEVKTLVNRRQHAGSYQVEFHPSGFASGVYFYRIQAGSYNAVKKMLLIK